MKYTNVPLPCHQLQSQYTHFRDFSDEIQECLKVDKMDHIASHDLLYN